MSRLIVNADDFGYTAGVDQAICALKNAGALSSITAMARGQALAEDLPALPEKLGIGCHVVFVDGLSSTNPNAVPSLLRDGQFRPSLGHFVVDLLRGRICDREVETEAVAQIRSLQARGLHLTHVDTHKHTHLFPRVLRPLLRAALQCGIRAVRNPFEPAWSQGATAGALVLRRMEVRVLGRYRAGFLREVERAGMLTPAGSLGVLATGVLNSHVLERLLSALARHGSPRECYELVCHPGFYDAALESQRTRLRVERERERSALLEVVPRWTSVKGPHQLVTFADL